MKEAPVMIFSRHILRTIIILLALTTQVWAQNDSTLVGKWVSSSGAQINITYPNEDNTDLVLLSVNGGKAIRAELESGDMDSVIMTYKTGGSVMTGYYNAMTKEISIYEGDKEYSTWKRR